LGSGACLQDLQIWVALQIRQVKVKEYSLVDPIYPKGTDAFRPALEEFGMNPTFRNDVSQCTGQYDILVAMDYNLTESVKAFEDFIQAVNLTQGGIFLSTSYFAFYCVDSQM
jgi:hypothetical protein